MVRILQGRAKVCTTVFEELEVSLAIEWGGKQCSPRLSKGNTIRELGWGRTVFGCKNIPELLKKYRAAYPSR